LVIAYALEPNRGSEHEVGLRWSVMIAKATEQLGYNVYVVTRAKKRKAIESIKGELPSNLHFIYFDFPQKLLFWKKGSLTVLLYYNLWQIGAFLKLKFGKEKVDPDIIHHVTFVNDYLPAYFAFFSRRAKFVWGPMASNNLLPCVLSPSIMICVKDRLKFFSKFFVRILNPLFWAAIRRADVLIVPTPGVKNRLKKIFKLENKFIILPQSSGLYLPEVAENKIIPKNRFVVLFAGQFIYLKSPHLVVDSFEHFIRKYEVKRAELIFIGDGPLRKFVEKRVVERNISDYVSFIERLPRNEFMEWLRSASVFLFPTVEEVGMVIFEAMLLEVPVITLKCAGLASFITSWENGITVECSEYQKMVNNITDILWTLYSNPQLRVKIGKSGKEMVKKNFSDKIVLDRLREIYEEK